jgi:hypothetical protein
MFLMFQTKKSSNSQENKMSVEQSYELNLFVGAPNFGFA